MNPTIDSPRPAFTVRHRNGAYPVYIGSGLCDRIGDIVAPLVGGRSTVVVTSERLTERYGKMLASSLGAEVPVLTLPDGEQGKNVETVLGLLDAFLSQGLTRDSVAIVVGGGVTGDTAGFASAIYLRGIDVVHIPTTLVAQVDSSVGGKVGVNLPQGKNLVGAFHPPIAVIADVIALATLPAAELRSGIFEALKAGVIGDPALFELLESEAERVLAREPAILADVVTRAVGVKVAIVNEDEYEGDRRRLLNYGHTIGHAIEAAMRYQGITHGDAVGWGMIAANAVAASRGMVDEEARRRIDTLIRRFAPAPLPDLDRGELISAVSRDKKFRPSRRVMILPRSIGECVVRDDIGENEIELGIEALSD